ncbi:conserved hypothetical protein [Coccidioides posadasii str. Silveira]|uniref:Uncharacterized protein n=1 Tax=Coccidioides posadasii (strain RMSCC 757 / Silveira) TaxID=443226 RepID=E9DJK7_COCPS|nr:conserved hypothetical protein [Coccidioides posadasii str. Silveira]
MTKDQDIKKLESESTMAEGTTESYATISQSENKRIVVHFHISMPSPGTANASWFDSRDATLFIERFYQMCKNYEDYLQAITKKSHAWDGNIHIYVQEYTTIANNTSPINFKKVVQVTMDLINQYEGNKKIFEEDEMKQKKMKKLALKKTASFVKTKESKSKFKAKGFDSTNIEAAIEKMINKFTNLALAMRVQSNQIQGNFN